MADIGDAIRVIPILPFTYRNAIANNAQPTGNGPIQNAAPFLAAPGAAMQCIDRNGALNYRATANSSGVWSFYELGPGSYYVNEANASRQWIINVAADLSFTVTPVTSSFPVNASSISIG
jgi:hypothetical protein